MSGFTHFDQKGNAVMVDVHEKADTYRVAVATGTITVNEEVYQAITNHTATCKTSCIGKTGVEMEAMTGVSVALLTIYDMCKAMDRGMEISGIHLVEKSGGKSGHYKAN